MRVGVYMNNIRESIEATRLSIKQTAEQAGRNADEIMLLAVTKTVDLDIIDEAIAYGITDVGENKPQELKRKYEAIGDKVKWHQIGSLQSNKVKYIIDKVELIHSLDRLSLANEIDTRAKMIDKKIDCLVQVNISGEESKHGLAKDDVLDFIKKCSVDYKNINIKGLMTMAPFDADETEIRNVFRSLKELSVEIKNENIENVDMAELSMGMSGDYKIAIEEGATIVRIGTSIFGKRNYSV